MKLDLGAGLLLGSLFVFTGLLASGIWHFRYHENHHDVTTTPASPAASKALVLSGDARAGRDVYRKNCKACHGPNAEGTSKGPSLILYERAHHGDGTFYRAVRHGVEAHHWEFGDMPPVATVKDKEIAQIIRFVRELQTDKENGE